MRISERFIEPAVLTARQVAQALGCHPKTVRALCQQGKIRAVKLGAEWRIPNEALDNFINGNEQEG